MGKEEGAGWGGCWLLPVMNGRWLRNAGASQESVVVFVAPQCPRQVPACLLQCHSPRHPPIISAAPVPPLFAQNGCYIVSCFKAPSPDLILVYSFRNFHTHPLWGLFWWGPSRPIPPSPRGSGGSAEVVPSPACSRGAAPRTGCSAARRAGPGATYPTASSVGGAHPGEVGASRAEDGRGRAPSYPQVSPPPSREHAGVGRCAAGDGVPPAEPGLLRRRVPPGFPWAHSP